MESAILRIICANQGAIDINDLLYNLFSDDPSKVSEIICNREKFISSCPNGQPKVVARTRLRLCRVRDCPETCRSLHLCKNFLFSGFCQFTQHRRGCLFSHDLTSDHNQRLLREHELESLSREELCTLLLQSDNTLLPEICYGYNNGDGEFGRCRDDDGCKRLHICKKYLSSECSCSKNHDFNAPQPLKALQARDIPGTLLPSLKALYANKEALLLEANREGRVHRDNQASSGEVSTCGNNTDASREDGGSRKRARRWEKGRDSNQGNRGGTSSSSDIHSAVNDEAAKGNKGQDKRQRPVRDKTEICIKGHWKHEDRCFKAHDKMPYRWEVQQGVQWTALPDNETTERDYCDPSKSYREGRVHRDNQASSGEVSTCGNNTDASREDGGSRKRARRWDKGRDSNQGNQEGTSSSSDIHAAVNDEAAKGKKGQDKRQRPVRDKTEICMYFIKGYCKHEDRCFKAHDKMPYRWEVQQGVQWTALPDNETTERDYCDPSKSYSSTSPSVHFDTMTCGSDKVRRLSTENSVIKPTFIHTTEWLWYWEDESGEWNMYSSDTGGHQAANINSTKLEEKFLTNDKDLVEFTAGSQSYSLSFQDMIQTNKRHGTKRLVCRRPRFVSAAEVLTRKVRRPLVHTSAPIPDNWDKTQIPQTGYSRVSLQRSSAEFKEVEALFCKTMSGFDIIGIERIQNKALWEAFQLQKNQMKSKTRGGNVTEKKLFHGTDSRFVDTICHNNFDWRICGTHGTAFGKGSYFARDAKYSHNYTGDADVRAMFISRVLVGHYTRGSSDYVRPPSKDGGEINFYDSCVNDVTNPSIFVVFEKHQIYPEYLLRYKTPNQFNFFGGPAATVAASQSTANSCVIA